MSDDSVTPTSADPALDQLERQVNRLVKQMHQLSEMQKVSYKSFAEVTSIENRRFALEMATRFLGKGVGTNTVLNSAATVGVADMWAKWLDDGTQPDMEQAALDTAAFAWGVAKGLFPESVIEAAKATAAQQMAGEQ